MLGRRSIDERVETRLETLSDHNLVQARLQFLHGPERLELTPFAPAGPEVTSPGTGDRYDVSSRAIDALQAMVEPGHQRWT